MYCIRQTSTRKRQKSRNKMEINKIYQGDSLSILKTFPDESINCIITSPPYWGLRDYGNETETIWDGDLDCEHEWGALIPPKGYKSGKHGPNSSIGAKEAQHAVREGQGQGAFCQKCNAWKGQLGLEPTFELYIKHLCDIFDDIKRVLRKDGTCWVVIGDTYGGSWQDYGSREGGQRIKSAESFRRQGSVKEYPPTAKPGIVAKCLLMIPFRFAIEMVNRGWILRNSIIWYKRNCMPASVKDRFTVDFEYIFFFVKSQKYWFEQQFEPHLTQENRPDGIIRNREFGYDSKLNALNKKNYSLRQKRGGNKNPDYLSPQGRNKRCVWDIPTKPFKGAHFAVFPETLVEPMIKSGCPEGGIILDPFMGSGTACLVAKQLRRNYIGIELNPEYIKIAQKRINGESKTLHFL